MLLAKLNNFFNRNKKIFYYIGFFLLVFGMSGDFVSAAFDAEELAKTTGELASFVLKGTALLLALVTYLATLFLTPEWINGTIFGLDVHFKEIWILVSNLVYFVFAFILIWIAFMNIIGKNNDQYQLKQALPKFIVGVLIVPFSWFFVQFMLSLSAILTISALTLPYDVSENPGYSNPIIPTECTIDLNNLSQGVESKAFFDCEPSKMSIKAAMDSEDSVESIFGIIAAYTYGVISIEEIAKVNAEGFEKIKVLSDLVVKIVFDVLFVLIYLILMITLAMVLIVRGVYLWIYTMLSPVFGLMYFFDKKEGGSGFFEKFNLKEFIALAMVPVYTMLALSFGLLFMMTIGTGLQSKTSPVHSAKGGDTDLLAIGTSDTFKLNVKGTPGSFDVKGTLTTFGGGTLGVIGGLIMKVFGIIVLWGAVMAAMRTSEITRQITQPIQDFGSQVGKIAASAPGNMPIFPGGQSMKSMGTIASGIEGKISQMNTKRGNDFLDKTPFGNNELTKSMNSLQSEIIKATSPNQKAALMKKVLANADGDFKQVYSNPAAQKALYDLVTSIKPSILEDLNIKKASDINSGELVADIYRGVEEMGIQYREILPENVGQINVSAMIKATENLKGTNVKSEPDTKPKQKLERLYIEPTKLAQLRERQVMNNGETEGMDISPTDIKEIAKFLSQQESKLKGLSKTDAIDKIGLDLGLSESVSKKIVEQLMKDIPELIKGEIQELPSH